MARVAENFQRQMESRQIRRQRDRQVYKLRIKQDDHLNKTRLFVGFMIILSIS